VRLQGEGRRNWYIQRATIGEKRKGKGVAYKENTVTRRPCKTEIKGKKQKKKRGEKKVKDGPLGTKQESHVGASE